MVEMISAANSSPTRVDHELDFLPLHQFALRFGGAALGFRGRFGDGAHIGVVHVAVQMRGEDAVDDQIGIAADGRREMRIAGRGQREMADV